VPEENLPGHHPDQDQDKPTGAPPVPPVPSVAELPASPAPAEAGVRVRFPFSFEPRVAVASALFGVTPFTAWVEVDADTLFVRFGLWSLRTAVDNVAGVERTGPYSWLKVAGPAHVSFTDNGLTFATSTRAGVCIRFHRPVGGALPFGLTRHPAVTVTVDDPDGLMRALSR
jgi:hypothetical protein